MYKRIPAVDGFAQIVAGCNRRILVALGVGAAGMGDDDADIGMEVTGQFDTCAAPCPAQPWLLQLYLRGASSARTGIF